MIEKMVHEIDDDLNFQMYVLDDIDENVFVMFEKEVVEQNKQYHFHYMMLFELEMNKQNYEYKQILYQRKNKKQKKFFFFDFKEFIYDPFDLH
jgi:hypothetical protein